MKKLICLFMLCVLATAAPASVSAAPYLARTLRTERTETADLPEAFIINAVAPPATRPNLSVSGEVLVISGLSDESFQDELNEVIIEKTRDMQMTAASLGAGAITFSNDIKRDGPLVSLIMVAKTDTTRLEEYVAAVHFNWLDCVFVTKEDVLGKNADAIVSRFVSETIKQTPDQYNLDLSGVPESDNFFVENGKFYVLFDKYAIAPGYMGVVKFDIVIADVKNVTVARSDYFVRTDAYNLKMIPLRTVCEGLGYTVSWDAASKATIVSKGGFQTKVTLGKNSYNVGSSARELEAPPEIRNGRVFLPISFFESILGAEYALFENDSILFSQYRVR